MWLLSTHQAELHFFPSPEAVPGGYAILSHTWGDNEQLFEETRDLAEWCKKGRKNPRDFASEKVRECCILAERHGYRWVWDDTCCIDKTSSTELSEAINSMFFWYSCAEVCYVHMEGVESDCVLDAPGSAFRTARWHSRGWTLQELIAPSLVVFVSGDWKKVFGTKVERASLLEEITGISRRVLTGEAHHSLVSVAERMSWASNRNTTRAEDEAYCLMGLFNINMPTIYGEGRHAFARLQHEIMKRTFDTTLFAWGSWVGYKTITPMKQHEMYQYFNASSQNHVYLLAHSPKCFVRPFGLPVWYTPSVKNPMQPYLDWQWTTRPGKSEPTLGAVDRSQFGPFGRIELPKFSVTNYGLECRFPIIESDGFIVAVILCDTGREHLGLLLHPSNNVIQDPSRKRYHTGYGFRTPSGQPGLARLISLGNDFYNLRVNGKTVTAEWRDILITDSPPPIKKDAAPNLCSPLHSIAPASPFRLPPWLISTLALLGMELLPLHMESKPVDGKPLQMLLSFDDVNTFEGIRLVLGTCTQSPDRLPHWAKAIPRTPNVWEYDLVSLWSHNCSEHHVDAWPGWTKEFGDPERTIRLSFSRSTVIPEHTLVVHIELEGSVYDAMKEGKKVVLPSRKDIGLVGSLVDAPLPPRVIEDFAVAPV